MVWQHIGWILLALVGLIVVKAGVLYSPRALFGVARPVAAEVALLLAQGGEFAFIVIGLASGKGLLEPEIATSRDRGRGTEHDGDAVARDRRAPARATGSSHGSRRITRPRPGWPNCAIMS